MSRTSYAQPLFDQPLSQPRCEVWTRRVDEESISLILSTRGFPTRGFPYFTRGLPYPRSSLSTRGLSLPRSIPTRVLPMIGSPYPRSPLPARGPLPYKSMSWPYKSMSWTPSPTQQRFFRPFRRAPVVSRGRQARAHDPARRLCARLWLLCPCTAPRLRGALPTVHILSLFRAAGPPSEPPMEVRPRDKCLV